MSWEIEEFENSIEILILDISQIVHIESIRPHMHGWHKITQQETKQSFVIPRLTDRMSEKGSLVDTEGILAHMLL